LDRLGAIPPRNSPPHMKIIPLNDQIVIRPLEAEERTAGGIVLPDSAREKPQQGRVLAVGDGRRVEGSTERAHPQVTEGDRILFARYAGSTVEVNGEELLILSERDILAVVG
jgi:chaperonin GroES